MNTLDKDLIALDILLGILLVVGVIFPAAIIILAMIFKF